MAKFEKGKPRHPNAGRKKGAPNKRTLEALALAEEVGVDPLRVLLELCKHRDPAIQLGAAKEAAKYLYSQRKVTEISGPAGAPVQFESSEANEIVAEFKAMLQTKLAERK